MFSFSSAPAFSPDPLTREAHTLARTRLIAEARAHITEERKAIEDHNHVDLYFGGQNQWPTLSTKELRHRYWRKALRAVPMKERIEAARQELKDKLRREVEGDLNRHKTFARQARKAARAEEIRRFAALKTFRRSRQMA